MKVYRSTATVKAVQFVWPENKPVAVGDMFHQWYVGVGLKGIYAFVDGQACPVGDYIVNRCINGKEVTMVVPKIDFEKNWTRVRDATRWL